MPNPLFRQTSPLVGWFILMEVLTAACLGAYWFEILRYGIRPWSHVGVGAVVTILFIVSNVLLFRHRGWAAVGFAVCWLLLALLMAPLL